MIAVSLGFPSAVEGWSNEEVLKFIHLMWERMRNEEDDSGLEGKSDPINYLDSEPTTKISGSYPPIKGKVGPLDPPTVVAVARKAFASLENALDEVSNLPSYKEPCFESPLVNDDAVMMEVSEDGIMRPIEPLEEYPSGMEDISFTPGDVALPTEYDQNIQTVSAFQSNKNETIVREVTPNSRTEIDPNRKRKNMDWLCRHLRSLNELANKPFNAAEMWELHQHFFTPVSQLNLANVQSPVTPCEEAQICHSHSRVPSGQISQSDDTAGLESSSLPILRRKQSFQVLSDVIAQSYYEASPSSKQVRSRPISVMIEENASSQNLLHRKKRAKRPKAKIAYFPRIKV